MSEKTIYAADLFAGAGGTSTGLIKATQTLGYKIDLTAVNHWEKAIKTHQTNYPWAKHLQEDVESVNPIEAIPRGHLNLLVASPECIHHSRAAGGRPKNEQQRSHAWAIFRWLELLTVDAVLIENVPEFAKWGPLDDNNKPVKLRRGEIYRAWIKTFRAHGYTVDAKILNSADYGAPTSRSRLFVMAIKGKKRPTFPTPTHSKQGWPLKKWRPAKEIIDWSIKGESIFKRKRPLSPRTIKRIVEGLKRFGGQELRPFIVLMEHGGGIHSVDEPLRTITTAKGGAMGLVNPDPDPFMLGYHAGKNCKDSRLKSIHLPLGTIDTSNRFAVVEPFITPNFGEHIGQNPRTHSIEEPLPSITSHGAGNLIEPLLIKYYGHGNCTKSVECPLDTITAKDRFGLVEPYLLQFNGAQESQIKMSPRDIEEPLPTIASQNHFGLVQPEINGYKLDVKFRMLQPHELAAATGFPKNYAFLGTKTQIIKQIGNAVVVDMAEALCISLIKKIMRN